MTQGEKTAVGFGLGIVALALLGARGRASLAGLVGTMALGLVQAQKQGRLLGTPLTDGEGNVVEVDVDVSDLTVH